MPPHPDVTRLAASNTPLFTKIAISKISEMLVESPANRTEFAKNPSAFFEKRLGAKPTKIEKEFLDNLKQQIADGFCCGGCLCSAPDPGANVILPAGRVGRVIR